MTHHESSPWEMADRPSHRPHIGEGAPAVPVTRQTGGSETETGGGKEKAILIPADERETEREGGRKRDRSTN